MSERRGWPLFWVVGGAIVLLVLVATGLVAGTGYVTSQRSTDIVWRTLADNVADRATGEAALAGARRLSLTTSGRSQAYALSLVLGVLLMAAWLLASPAPSPLPLLP